jgi:hypothetical protein
LSLFATVLFFDAITHQATVETEKIECLEIFLLEIAGRNLMDDLIELPELVIDKQQAWVADLPASRCPSQCESFTIAQAMYSAQLYEQQYGGFILAFE